MIFISAWWISGRTRPHSPNNDGSPFYNIHFDESIPQPTTFLGRLTSHPVWAALSADVFTGQIIASLIVLTFVAVFLLREWISQNARPGIFEDDEILPEEGIAPRVAPRPPAAAQPPPHPLEEALALRQAEALRALEALRERPDGHNVVKGRPQDRTRLIHKRGKGRRGRKYRSGFDMRAATRRNLPPTDAEEEEEEMDYEEERTKRKVFMRRIRSARLAGVRQKTTWHGMGQEPLARIPLEVDPKFQFTFVPPSATAQASPPVMPSISDGVKPVPSPSAKKPDGGTPLSSSSLNQKRPTLPSSSTPDLVSLSESSSSSAASQAVTQRLASYRAPEELEEAEAGPSRLPDPFEVDDDTEDEAINQKEFLHYFDDPESDEKTSRPGTPSDDDTDKEGDVDDEGWRQNADDPMDDVFEHDGEDEEPGEMEDFVFDAWEAAEGEVAGDGAGLEPGGGDPRENVIGLPPREQGAVQNPVPEVEIPPEFAEELEGNVEDDMEGAMEGEQINSVLLTVVDGFTLYIAIGMRGPFYGVLQNVGPTL